MTRTTNQVPAANTTSAARMNPGDEAPAGTPGTGEDVCPMCHGDGKRDGRACSHCAGTGRVVQAIGGA